MTKRTLSLKRETLAELSDADLGQVLGANAITGITCVIHCPIYNTYRICIETDRCPTLFC